jgi:octaheme c-type cytochrome (tetrathionate reductase family)
MKFKSMTARPAVLFQTVMFAICLMLLPMQGQAALSVVKEGVEKGGLTTVQDFIEHAANEEVDIHELYFDLRPYEGTKTCLMCHEKEGPEMLNSAHFKWEGKVDRIVGLEGKVHGKNDLLNNFCVAVPTNEERCSQCHAGYGYKDKYYDFTDPLNIDCLVCHDQSGTYAKDPKNGGMPAATVDLQLVAGSVRQGSKPTRKACMSCHAKAGGGDNVKHGDLATTIVNTTREYDVHMGTDGADLSCVACHGPNHDPETGEISHGIAGMPLHSVNEGVMKQCTDCHGARDPIHAGSSVEPLFAEGWHDNLACQVCHIPAIARNISTKVEWYWSDAGQDISPIPTDPDSNPPNRPTYDKKKGTFVWANNVRPTLRFSNGYWNRKVINVSDSYDSVPIDLGSPVGDYTDSKAMIYPFKLMVGDQPVDLGNKTVMVPHLFKTRNGPNPYWGIYDWNLSLIDGAAYTGQEYSGTFGFEETTMLLTVNHEVAPKEKAYGMDSECGDCHASSAIDWQALGWTADPFDGGERVDPEGDAVLDWFPPMSLGRTVD